MGGDSGLGAAKTKAGVFVEEKVEGGGVEEELP